MFFSYENLSFQTTVVEWMCLRDNVKWEELKTSCETYVVRSVKAETWSAWAEIPGQGKHSLNNC